VYVQKLVNKWGNKQGFFFDDLLPKSDSIFLGDKLTHFQRKNRSIAIESRDEMTLLDEYLY
jgi:hypothetical protein